MDTKPIKVTTTVSSRLDQYKKKGASYSQVIESFLDYFDTTGTKPTDVNSSPVSLFRDGIKRNIAILKNIESKKIDPMNLKIQQILDYFKNNSSPQKTETNSNEITDEEIEKLLEKIEFLQKTITVKETEISNLHAQLSKIPLTQSNDNRPTLLKIKESILELNENKQLSGLKKNDFQIDKSIWNRNIDSILNLINNLI